MQTGYKSLRPKRVRQRTQTRTNKRGGRKPGQKNLATLIKEEAQLRAMAAANGKLAVEEMDVEIARFADLERVLYPWDKAGQKLNSKSVQAYYWACEMRRDYLALRAPYQTPRLSAVQVIPAGQSKRQTTVNVTILNERGEQEYSDLPDGEDDPKLIEGTVAQGEEAA